MVHIYVVGRALKKLWQRQLGRNPLKRTTLKNWYEEKDLKPHTQKPSLLYLPYCQHCQSIPEKKVCGKFLGGTFLIICCTFHVFWIMSWERNVLKKNHCLIMAEAWGGKVIIFVQDDATSSIDCIPVTGLLQLNMLQCKKNMLNIVRTWKSVARSDLCGQGHKRLCLQRVGMPKHKRCWPLVKRQGGQVRQLQVKRKSGRKIFARCPRQILPGSLLCRSLRGVHLFQYSKQC